MEKNEQETIILLNEGDMAEGFFRVSTSRERIYRKILKRIDCDIYSPTHIYIGRDNSNQFNMKIPIKYLSKTHFGIRKAGKIQLTEEERERRAQVARNNFCK